MIFEMVTERLTALANRWKDLADSFRRLAKELPATVPPKTPATFGEVDPTKPELGFQRNCFHKKLPADLVGDIGEYQRVEAAKLLLKPTDPLVTAGGTTGTINATIDIFRKSLVLGPNPNGFSGLVNLIDQFGNEETSVGEFPDPTQDTTEVAACRDRLRALKQYVGRQIEDLNELLEEVSQRFYLSGIRDSVDNLSGYPVLTSEMSVRPTGSGSAGDGQGGGGTRLRQAVDGAMTAVLGRLPKVEDNRSFVLALTQSFQAYEVAGSTGYRWTPRSFVGQTDLGGGVTGGQASLYSRAKAIEDNVLDLLDGLYPLREDADDELTEAARGIVRSQFTALVGELALEGGPRRARVEDLLNQLFDRKVSVDLPGGKTQADGHLGMLQLEFGLNTDHVNTLEEENNVTNFIALRDYIDSIRTGWRTFESTLYGKDLGTRLVLLSRALSVAAASVEEVCEAMDSVFVGSAERQVASFRDDAGKVVFVSEVLGWITTFTSTEAPGLVNTGGRKGVEAIIPTTITLRDFVDRLVKSIPFEAGLPDAMRHPRVLNPLRELRGHLDLVRRHAEEVKRP
jgi:hypothetical protein